MNISSSAKFAKIITSKKRTRLFWNVFFAICISIILVGTLIYGYHIMADRSETETKEIFLRVEGDYICTKTNRYDTTNYNNQVVKLEELKSTVSGGDEIVISISNISGELLEVNYKEKTVYKKNKTPILPLFIFIIPMFALMVFLLIVTNIKHPSKFVDKIQRQYLLRFYK